MVTVRSTTFRMVCTFSGSGRPISRLTAWPTINSVSLAASTPRVATVPTLLPLRRMVTRSLMASTSFSLWVMMIMAQPLARMRFKILNSLLVSCGVSTAVGSSRIRIFAPRYSTFNISTVCFSETLIPYTGFSGSISRP